MRKNNTEKELHGFAVGGQTILGKPSAVVQAIDEADPKKRGYCPPRDVLHFFPSLMLRVITAFQQRAIPAIEDRFKADKDLEAKVIWGLESLSRVVSTARDTTYPEAMEEWLQSVDDDVAECIISAFGRAILEFYFCCLMQVKTLNINGAEPTKAAVDQIRSEAGRYKECRRSEKVSAAHSPNFFQRCAASWRKWRARWATKNT